MERFIADLVGKFETGTISRRDFCVTTPRERLSRKGRTGLDR